MRIYENQTANVLIGAAPAFKLKQTTDANMLMVFGTPDGATVKLYLSNSATGTFVPALNALGTEVGEFVDKVGAMALEPTRFAFGKLTVAGVGVSTDLTVDYGDPDEAIPSY